MAQAFKGIVDFTGIPSALPAVAAAVPVPPGYCGIVDFTGIPCGQPEVPVGRAGSAVVAGRRILNAEAARQLAERERALLVRRRQAEMAKRAMIESGAANQNQVAAFALILAEV